MKRFATALMVAPGTVTAQEPIALDEVLAQLDGTFVSGEGTIHNYLNDDIRFIMSANHRFDLSPNVPYDTLLRLEQCTPALTSTNGCQARVTGHLRMHNGSFQIVATEIAFLD